MAVTAQLEAARRSLEFKDFVGALEAAGKTLELDPNNAEAKEVVRIAQARLDEVEAAATAARQAARAGDVDAASEALARVLALAPKHPVAAELSGQLDSRFKARADAASRAMKAESESARRAGAYSLRAYAEAAGLAGRAEAAYSRRQYTEAAQKFAEAERAYASARAEAQALAARATPSPAVVAAASAAPTPAVAPPTLPPATLPPPPPPPSPTPSLAPAPTQPPKPVVSDEAAVRHMLASLERAIEEKDLALYKRLRPNLPAEDEHRLKDAFHNVASQQVDYTIESIAFDGDRALVRVTRSGRVSGQTVPPVRQVIHLARDGSGWVITDIGQ
jgi:tetratricopeptide (TPR) repeat protein